MPWDDELRGLVTDLFAGDETEAAIALTEATCRAIDVVSRQSIDLAEDAKMSLFHDALKAEVRRLMRPH
jgi:hypothetical protein